MRNETITVGYAFIHHRFAQDVPQDEKPLSEEVSGPGHLSLCGAQGGLSGLPGERVQDWKGKEPMSLDSSPEQSRPGYQDTIPHSIPPRNSLEPVRKLGCHRCELVEEIDSGSIEGGVSELQDDIFPPEVVRDKRGSEDSVRASESFGSPLSDLYEDVLESCSPLNSIP